MYRYFDTHSHKKRAQNQGSDVLIVENIRIGDQKTVSISSSYFSVGIHPYDAQIATQIWFEELEMLALQSSCIAIGECGIDKRYPNSELQLEILERHIALSNRLHKPLVIHCVHAENEILKALKFATEKIIFHSYSHFDQQIARQENITLSLAERALTNPNVTKIPTNRILIETDESELLIEEMYTRYTHVFSVDNIEFQAIIRNNFYNIFNIL